MLTLAIDTSTPAVSAGVAEVQAGEAGPAVTLFSEQVLIDDRAHGERLTPLIAAALRAADAVPADLEAVVAGCGPGPFTGLRAGLATAAALSDALNVPSYPVGSVHALAHQLGEVDADVLVAADARRAEIYWTLQSPGEAPAAAQVCRPQDLPPRARQASRAVGYGASKHAATLDMPTGPPLYPAVRSLLALAAPKLLGGEPGQPLTPIYLRRPNVNIAGKQQRV